MTVSIKWYQMHQRDARQLTCSIKSDLFLRCRDLKLHLHSFTSFICYTAGCKYGAPKQDFQVSAAGVDTSTCDVRMYIMQRCMQIYTFAVVCVLKHELILSCLYLDREKVDGRDETDLLTINPGAQGSRQIKRKMNSLSCFQVASNEWHKLF